MTSKVDSGDKPGGQLPGIEFENFSLEIGGRLVLNDVNIGFGPAETNGLLGPKGAGKSTLLRSIVGLESFTGRVNRRKGRIRIGGLDLPVRTADLRQLRRRVALVPATAAPFALSIYENVASGLRSISTSREALRGRVEKCLERCGLGEVGSNQPALSLSQGERRFLCIARALIMQPAALLLDEPFDGLDPYETSRMESLLASLGSEHTVVVATQHAERASAISTSLSLMIGGELIESGPTTKLLANPGDNRTEAYLSGRGHTAPSSTS